jgi:hypothetical protein
VASETCTAPEVEVTRFGEGKGVLVASGKLGHMVDVLVEHGFTNDLRGIWT